MQKHIDRFHDFGAKVFYGTIDAVNNIRPSWVSDIVGYLIIILVPVTALWLVSLT